MISGEPFAVPNQKIKTELKMAAMIVLAGAAIIYPAIFYR
jgi:hypothetical protein